MTSSITQLPLFDNLDERPLPILVAEKYRFVLQHYEPSEEQPHYLYAVLDWVRGVARTDNPRRFWADMKRAATKAHVQLYEACVQLPYTATNGKTYRVDFASAETLYLIAQRMNAETGIRNAILRYLAKAGVKVDQDRQRALADPNWAMARRKGIEARNGLTGVLSIHVLDMTPRHYANATNAVYTGLWNGRTAAVLKTQMELKKNDNLRDHQPAQAIAYQTLVESSAAMIIQQIGAQSPEQALETIHRVAQTIGVQARDLGDILGIDLATGKLLPPQLSKQKATP